MSIHETGRPVDSGLAVEFICLPMLQALLLETVGAGDPVSQRLSPRAGQNQEAPPFLPGNSTFCILLNTPVFLTLLA